MKEYNISMNNGLSYKAVSELTNEDVASVIEDINSSDAQEVVDARNELSGCGDNDREWLMMFLERIGDNWIVG